MSPTVDAGPVELRRYRTVELVVGEHLEVPAVRAFPPARDVAHDDVVVRAERLPIEVQVIHHDSVCLWPLAR